MKREDLSVGQEVVLHSQYNRHNGGKKRGTVVKVGRTLVTIKGPMEWDNGSQFRIESQFANGDFGSSEWFRTLEQEALEKEFLQAETVLRKHMLDTRPYGPIDWEWRRKVVGIANLLETGALTAEVFG